MAITRINNNQITDSVAGNLYLGVNAAVKVQDYTITAGKIANNLTYGSDLTITGNLTVQGNTTAIDTINLVVEDPLILLAKEQTGAPALDIGFIGKRGTEDNIAFVWDESADQFVAVFTTSEVTNSTININSYASLQVLDLTAANANITGNLTFNGTILGNVTVSGNVDADNLNATAAVTAGTTITATGNVSGGNITTAGNVDGANVNATAGITAGTTIVATGNVSGGNVTTAGNIDGANVNATSGITAGTTVIATGNVSGGNITTTGNVDGANVNATSGITAGTTVVATGNVTGGNLTTAGNVDGANLNATAGITAGTTIVATGNVDGGNLNTTGLVTGGNAVFTGDIASATLNTTGNATIGGNLIVQGNITYINIDDLRIEDPVIIMGTGANGTPPTVDDGQDRGIFMEYYSTSWGNAFVGWDRSANSTFAAVSVEFSANNVINVLEYGTFTAGNANLQSANASGNITGGNLVTAGDVTTATVTASSNIGGANVNATSGITAGTTVIATGNVSGGNLTTAGNVDGANVNATSGITAGTTVIATGNVSGGNLTTAGNVDGANVNATSGITAGTTIVATGNVTGGNLTTAGDVTTATVTATGNISGGNIVTTGTADLGNIRITGDDITNFASNIITINSAGSDIDLVISGDTVANLLVVDAGTDTVVIGGANATTGASFKVDTTDSMMPPVGNTLQRPGTPVLGMFRFNTGGDALEVYTSSGWEDVGVPAFTVIIADAFVGDGSTLAFTLSANSTTAGTIVAINGVVQEPTTAYSVSGVTLTFTEAPAISDNIDARILTTTTTVTNIENTSGNAVIEALDSADTIQVTGNLLPQANVTFDLGSTTLRWRDGYFAGNSITLGNIVMKNTGGNSFGIFGPDGTTPATLDANVEVVGDAIESGTSNVSFAGANGNVLLVSGGNTTGIITDTGANITGTLNATGNANVGNLGTAGLIVATGNITGGNLITAGLVSLASITKTGSNGVGNIGSSTSVFDTVFAKATSAQYADLAEMYESDAVYEPGTVLCFGGAKEVTLCGQADSTRVAGVVSTNPSYIMNSGQIGDCVVAVALTGRVPTRVTGTVRKGDLMVSTGDGRARANNGAAVGTVIGKALADFDGADGVIEVVVGRV